MAERLIAALCALGALLAGSSASPAALAQALHDPMRPPAGSDPSATEASKDSVARTARLQSVLISPGRRVAVIDGRVVRLGERVGDATLVAISESQVVLQRPGGRETLKLNPVVNKKAARKGPVP
ncbi:MAG: MSHA biogenesis protein MshK [Betaproteobacteria bacterium]|nr:MAG: MSHA biogenesis protein MshK [Betaproteobacteria bacterium]